MSGTRVLTECVCVCLEGCRVNVLMLDSYDLKTKKKTDKNDAT